MKFLILFIATVLCYDVSTLTVDYKKTICATQTGFCTSNCGGTANTNINFCSTQSLKWNCECKTSNLAPYPNAPDSTFPVQYYQCVGEKQECYKKCLDQFGVDTAPAIDCKYNQCDVKFACGSTKGGEAVDLRVKGDGSDILNNENGSSSGAISVSMNQFGIMVFLASLLL